MKALLPWSIGENGFHENPRDYNDGHPNGHETWGHGQTFPPYVENTTLSETQNDTILDWSFIIYILIAMFSFVLNNLAAVALIKMQWGLKIALLWNLCIAGLFLGISNTIHFITNGLHLISQVQSGESVLQMFAFIAFFDNMFGFLYTILVIVLSVFCSIYYRSRDAKQNSLYGRRFIVPIIVVSSFVSFITALVSSIYQCDAHLVTRTCVRITCISDGFLANLFTKLITVIKYALPIPTFAGVVFSVRIAVANQVPIHGHSDMDIFLISLSIIGTFGITNLIPQMLMLHCFSRYLALLTNHHGVIIATLSAPISLLIFGKDIRLKIFDMFGAGMRQRRQTIPQASYAHIARKYKQHAKKEVPSPPVSIISEV
ncbi:unnamed protein product [Caenorhabditis bovis]|uniref:Uncharacterized protein n=1 Tax=Caenorhabditis bovis TaxID=2654633 RepID=A0A8S1EU68_9PELO|nr:unnamed protein product [Caenorhabditis bovis]